MRLRALAPLLLLATAACPKRAPSSGDMSSGDAAPSGSASARTASAADAGAASAATTNKPMRSRTCRLDAKGAVTVTEGRGGGTHAIAANASAVLVTWGELRAPSSGFGPEDAKQRWEMARAFDATLAPRGAAYELGRQSAVDAFSNGAAPFALADAVGAATCAWAAFAGNLDCSLTAPGAATFKPLQRTDKVAGPGPEGDRMAATAVGDGAIAILPQCQDVRVYASGAKATGLLAAGSAEALIACEKGKTIDVPAVAAADAGAIAVWRHAGAIEARAMDDKGAAKGALATLSAPKTENGAPAIAWSGGAALVVWASRASASAKWELTLARFTPGAPVTRVKLVTGAEPAMAPAIAATDDAKCALVSWTEGAGAATHARAALACDDAIVTASAVDVSRHGVEAGDSELARASNGAYVVWQELPKGKPSELELARIVCD